MTDHERRTAILQFIDRHGDITVDETEDLLRDHCEGDTKRAAHYTLQRMLRLGSIKRTGRGTYARVSYANT